MPQDDKEGIELADLKKAYQHHIDQAPPNLDKLDFCSCEMALEAPQHVTQIELADFRKARAGSLFFQMYNGLSHLSHKISKPEPESPRAHTEINLSSAQLQQMRRRYDPTK